MMTFLPSRLRATLVALILTVAAGATFEGSCRRSNDPLNLAAPTPQISLSKPAAPAATLVQPEAKSA